MPPTSTRYSTKQENQNGNTDALSRLPLREMPVTTPVPGDTIMLMDHLAGTTLHSGHIQIGPDANQYLPRYSSIP